MSNDSSSDLDTRIAAIVERTVGKMRDELMQRMQDTESQLREISSRLGGDAPAGPGRVAPEPAEGGAISDLFDPVAAIDRGGSQQEVLAALLEGCGRFASRAALFLTRADGAQGWGSYGFEETARDMQEVVLSYAAGPLALLAEGRGCVGLTAEECGELCSPMEVTPAAEGLLVPFVLRDRLAAALYVDRFADDPPLGEQSLQLLAYVAALAVEGLAVRQRSETPTLQVAAEAATAPGVALWEGAPAAPMVEEPVEEQPVEEAPEAALPVSEPPAAEPALPEAPPMEAPPVEMPTPEAVEEEAPAPLVEEPAEVELEVEPEAELPVEPEAEAPAETGWEMSPAPLEVPEEAMAEPPEEPTPPPETLAEPTPAAPIEEEQPWADTAGAGFSTVEIDTVPETPEAPPPIADQPAASPGTTEVRPPSDVSGPGWAFTASRAAAEAGDDAQHEEARRLARLLVTEIKLYNEEQVEEGRRGNDIYARLREDIDRSRQIFNERVDEAVRQETDYFHEEMVRILAGGNAEALGL